MSFKSYFFLLCIAGIISIACSFEDEWMAQDESIISSDYFLHKSLSPFFYNPYSYLDGGAEHNSRFDSIIIDEWSSYFENKVNRKNLAQLILQSNENDINEVYNSLRDNKNIVKYSFLLKQDRAKVLDFLKYLANAKHAELYACAKKAEWDDINNKDKFNSQPAFEKQLISLFEKTKDPFIKQRYLFQIIRYQYFNKTDASLFFNTYKNLFPKNTIYYRTLSYLAGSVKQFGKIPLANYYYSLVFENCDALKPIAHYGFRPQEETDWKGTLALCQNNGEKITLWAMLGIIYKDPTRSIEEIYQLNPKHRYLDLLATRYIQSLEETVESPILYRAKLSEKKDADESSDNFTEKKAAIIYRIASAGNTENPFLWNCMGAYLSMIRTEYSKTPEYISRAKKMMPQKTVDKSLVRLLDFIYRLSTMKTIGTDEEKILLSELTWLLKEKHDKDFYYSLPLQLAISKISNKYKEQNEYLKAECFRVGNSYYAKETNLVSMQNFLLKKDKTPYENLMDSLYQYNLDNLYEHEAILHTLAGNLHKAKALMEKVPEDVLLGNPFNNNIKDCHDCDHEAYKGTPYSSLSLINKMILIESKLNSGEEVYTNALLLGNAYYNISHLGNARLFSESAIIGVNSSGWSIDSNYKKILLSMQFAKKYYSIALEKATTDEQKAKCYFLLSKCERNEWYYKTTYSDYLNEYEARETPPDFIAWTSFSSLKKYLNTKYGQEVIKECGYFKTYLASNK